MTELRLIGWVTNDLIIKSSDKLSERLKMVCPLPHSSSWRDTW